MPEQLPQSFESIGYLAAGLQLPVAVIAASVKLLDISPAYYQNGIGFYGDDARHRLMKHLFEADLLHHLDRGQGR